MCLGIPGQIVEITPNARHPRFAEGRVRFGEVMKTVSLAYVPEASVGDYVLVHAGFALHTLDEAEALRTLEYVRQLGELKELDEAAP